MPKIEAFGFGVEISTQDFRNTWNFFANKFSSKTFHFSNAFAGNDDRKNDWCFYQLGLRPDIPIVDFYYLQYLLSLLRKDLIGTLVIYPSIDLSFPQQAAPQFKALEQRINEIFGKHMNRVRILDPEAQKNNLASLQLLSPDFLDSLKYIASEGFQAVCRHILGDPKWTWLQCNRYHPENLRLVSIYVHTVRGYIMWRYLAEELASQAPASRPTRVGFLIWETEMAKLAVFARLKDATVSSNLQLNPILGRSVLLGPDKPLPVYVSDQTVTIYGDPKKNLHILVNSDKRHNQVVCSILEAVLRQNYPEVQYKPSTKALTEYGNNLVVGSVPPTTNSDALKAAWLIDRCRTLSS